MSSSLIESLILGAENQPAMPLYYFLDSRGEEYAKLSYGSLLEAVQRLGTWLTEKTASGDRVAIQLPTSPEFVISFFACLYANRIPVPLSSPNRRHNCEHYQKIFADCDARLAISDASVRDLFEKENLEAANKIATFPALDIDPLLAPVDRQGNEIAFLQYTSGSTSFPKGVMVSHENIIANQKMIQRAFSHSRDSVGLAWVPLFHDMGLIGSVFQPLYVGFSCYFMAPVTFLQRPKLWFKTISDKQVTTTGGPNFAYDLCVKRIAPDSLADISLSSWDVAYNGAEHIKLDTLQNFNDTFAGCGFKKSAFLPCYGLAEATLIVSSAAKSQELLALTIPCNQDDVLDGDASQRTGNTRIIVSNGQVAPELSARIINPQTLAECPSHHIGEIWVAGPSITLGYWQNPKQTQETFVVRDRQRFLRTGDLGFLDSQDRLYITGRLKDLIVIEGRNYYPQDIEETVKKSHPALHDVNCAVFSVSSTSAQKLVVVSEVMRHFGQQIDRYADEIVEAAKTSVHHYYGLRVNDTVLLPVNSIPKTTSGKIQRQRTKLLYLLQQLESLEKVTKISGE